MSNNKKYTADDIRSLDTSQWYKKRLFERAEIDTLYVILGFLQEYFGGFSLHDTTVDMFFVDEYDKALLFKALCDLHLKSKGLQNDVSLHKVESGHSYVVSQLICDELKTCFVEKLPDFLNHKCHTLSKNDDLFKSPEALYGNRDAIFNFKRYSYLLGVIIKNKLKDKPAINFANASHKAELAIDILKDFSAFGDFKFGVEYYFGAPHVTRITLDENNAIWNEVNAYIDLLST